MTLQLERNWVSLTCQLYESYEFQPRGGAVNAKVVTAKDKDSNNNFTFIMCDQLGDEINLYYR